MWEIIVHIHRSVESITQLFTWALTNGNSSMIFFADTNFVSC